MLRPMQADDLAAVNQLWNHAAESRDIIHKALDPNQFRMMFMDASADELKYNLVEEDNGRVIGFGNAYHRLGSDLGYVTFILVDPQHRRQGVGSRILAALEARLREYPGIARISLNFFNPINLEWLIPGTPGHDHPNAPGVDVDSPAFPFFQARGYVETARQYSYYQPLERFTFQPKIAERQAALAANGTTITYYDPAKHYGLDELFTNLGNEDWREKIMGNINSTNPYPVLIVQREGRVGGFAGPLFVQPSGRGYFAGIGVHSEFRGGGAGSVLFSCLCQGLKDVGATFMSLFTGKANVARTIYESAGFTVVHEWACMRKELH